MKIVISSASTATLERWKSILQDQYQLLEASTGEELSAILDRQAVDLVLLHRSMVDLDFISGLQSTTFFVFSDRPEDAEAYTLLRMGAAGYANTYISAVRLKEAVHVALSGRVWVGQKLMQKIIRGTTAAVHRQPPAVQPTHNLSDREWEVAVRVSKGQSNLTIAADMDISERTVKAHISSIFKKTGTESRLQLALHVKALLSNELPQT